MGRLLVRSGLQPGPLLLVSFASGLYGLAAGVARPAAAAAVAAPGAHEAAVPPRPSAAVRGRGNARSGQLAPGAGEGIDSPAPAPGQKLKRDAGSVKQPTEGGGLPAPAPGQELLRGDGNVAEVLEVVHGHLHMFKFRQPVQPRQSPYHRQIAVGLFVLIVMATLPVLVKQGARPFAVALTYVACLVAVMICVKDALSSGYKFPYTITALHMMLTSVAGSIMGRPKLRDALRVFPIALFGGASLLFNNSALVYGTGTFVSMIGTCTPASTYIAESAIKPGDMSGLRALAVAVVCLGAGLCIHGEIGFSVAALVLAMAANVCRSAKAVLQHHLLKVKLSPWELTAWTGLWSLSFMVPIVAYSEGLEGIHSFFSASLHVQLMVGASGLVAMALNLTQCVALDYLGPVMANVVGNLQLIGMLCVSALVYGDAVCAQQGLGALMVTGGCLLAKLAPLPEQVKPGGRYLEGWKEATA